jgi:rhodanese-related sulfurtransferase
MNKTSVRHLDRNKTYVTYCDGIGCNASTKGAYKLASLGFKVKEMLGGLDFWRRDGNPIATGDETGSMTGSDAIVCNC